MPLCAVLRWAVLSGVATGLDFAFFSSGRTFGYGWLDYRLRGIRRQSGWARAHYGRRLGHGLAIDRRDPAHNPRRLYQLIHRHLGGAACSSPPERDFTLKRAGP